jgi:hypothetical protein
MRLVSGRDFTVLIPSVARMQFHEQDQRYWITDLPQCRYFCAVGLHVGAKDATRSLESFVAQLRFADSTNQDPDMTAYQPGPATRLAIGNDTALVVQANCGDCTAGIVFIAQGGKVASLEYSIDAQEGYQPALVCRLVAIARTFRWSS